MDIQSPCRWVTAILVLSMLVIAGQSTASDVAPALAARMQMGADQIEVQRDLAEDDVNTFDDSRPSDEFQADIRDSVDRDRDVANTALTFNNLSMHRAVVVCRAFNGAGEVLGRKSVHVAPNGLRYLRASDIAGGADFVGSAECKSRMRVQASAVFLAPGVITSLDAIHRVQRTHTSVRFPLVATY